MRPIRDKSGKSLERLVAGLELALAGTNASIEAPSRRLIDRDTGLAREHDVLIIWDHGHHQIVTAIECRDRSRPVGVPDVEAFADKCVATGVHTGVIVSASGFQNSARAKAKARAILCMDLQDAVSFDWLHVSAIEGLERRYNSWHFEIFVDGGGETTFGGLFDDAGEPVIGEQIRDFVANHIGTADIGGDAPDGAVVPVRIHLETPNWQVSDGEGNLFPVSYIFAESSFTVIRSSHQLTLRRYVGGGREFSLASAEMTINGRLGNILLVRNEDDTTSIVWSGGSGRPR